MGRTDGRLFLKKKEREREVDCKRNMCIFEFSFSFFFSVLFFFSFLIMMTILPFLFIFRFYFLSFGPFFSHYFFLSFFLSFSLFFFFDAMEKIAIKFEYTFLSWSWRARARDSFIHSFNLTYLPTYPLTTPFLLFASYTLFYNPFFLSLSLDFLLSFEFSARARICNFATGFSVFLFFLQLVLAGYITWVLRFSFGRGGFTHAIFSCFSFSFSNSEIFSSWAFFSFEFFTYALTLLYHFFSFFLDICNCGGYFFWGGGGGGLKA
ncbi:hypothetical protein DFH27DRAFT_187202 [Peziza echinospora]|nr:hypothetical protein DFH27DRAFT_187202 [Peziza echinospora]